EDPAGRLTARATELRQRSRVERPRLDAVHAQPSQPATHLAGGLVGERDREDLVGAESPRSDLPPDPPRDRGRLPGAGPREDANGPAHGLGRPPLLRVEPSE